MRPPPDQKLGFGERSDEVFAGTHSLAAVKLLVHKAARDGGRTGPDLAGSERRLRVWAHAEASLH